MRALAVDESTVSDSSFCCAIPCRMVIFNASALEEAVAQDSRSLVAFVEVSVASARGVTADTNRVRSVGTLPLNELSRYSTGYSEAAATIAERDQLSRFVSQNLAR